MQLPDRSPLTPEGNRFRPSRSSTRRRLLVLVFLLAATTIVLWAQETPWSARVASAVIAGQPAGESANSWGSGLELEGIDAAWYNTADGDYFRYVRRTVDAYLDAHPAGPRLESGASTGGRLGPLLASQVLFLYRVTLAPRYYSAAEEAQSRLLPSCTQGGPTSARSLPIGCAAAQPFLAEYASVFQRTDDFAAITASFENWYAQLGDSAMEHSDAGEASLWRAGQVRLIWSLVESLPHYPEGNSGRSQLIEMFGRLAEVAIRHLEAGVGRPEEKSANCLLVFALEKGVRLGYLPDRFTRPADKAWRRMVSESVVTDRDGVMRLAPGTARESGAAAEAESAFPGALLLAATEADHSATATLAHGETVLLDAWYNSQRRMNAAGQEESFHYKWSDESDSGYALLGHIFGSYGARTETLDSPPTQAKLTAAQFYIIVSPDIPVKNPQPHYMTEADADQIAAWVKRGGVLAMFENDPPNADIDHLNLLADRFGMHFDNVLHHHILGEHVEDGRIPVSADGALFHHSHTLYMKDTCAISLRSPATVVVRDRGDVVMAAVRFGRGTVFAAVDPWVYNEYTDGRKNPLIYSQFDNFAGGEEFVRWLLEQHPR